MDKYELKLKAFKIMLENLKTEVEEFIQSIEDSELRQILRYRYMDGNSWVKITHIMGYDSENKARMKVERFLEKSNKF